MLYPILSGGLQSTGIQGMPADACFVFDGLDKKIFHIFVLESNIAQRKIQGYRLFSMVSFLLDHSKVMAANRATLEFHTMRASPMQWKSSTGQVCKVSPDAYTVFYIAFARRDSRSSTVQIR